MIAEAIKYIVGISKPEIVAQPATLSYSDKQLNLIVPPVVPGIEVNTLTGFIDVLESGVGTFDPAQFIIKIVDHSKVQLIAKNDDGYGRRNVLVSAGILTGISSFAFDRFIAQEDFIIAVAAGFVPTPDLATIISAASKITVEGSVETEDDGITQKAAMKAGIALKGMATLKSRVTLAPYRTFRDIAQPESDFIFRVKPGPSCALFEADGGAWKLTAIKGIREYFGNALKGSSTAGLADIPVIA